MRLVLIFVSLVLFSATAWAGHSERRLIQSKDTAIVYPNGDVAYWLTPETTKIKVSWDAYSEKPILADSCTYPIKIRSFDGLCARKPSLTIYYVDTVGWQYVNVYSENHGMWGYHVDGGDGFVIAPFGDEDRKEWRPVTKTVIVGTVYIDKMPDKHKQLLIRKDQ